GRTAPGPAAPLRGSRAAGTWRSPGTGRAAGRGSVDVGGGIAWGPTAGSGAGEGEVVLFPGDRRRRWSRLRRFEPREERTCARVSGPKAGTGGPIGGPPVPGCKHRRRR